MVNVMEPADIRTGQLAEEKWSRMAYAKKSARLYMKTVPLRIAGDYQIEVREAVGDPEKSDFKPVARAVVKVVEKPGTFWFPWGEPDKEPAADSGSVEDFSHMQVANPVGGVALPEWKGYMGIAIDKIPDGKQPLPQITPADADPGIQLSVKGSRLTVKLADDEISTYFPDDHFLTRWWVNGKPVQLKVDAPDQKWNRAIGAADVRVKEIRFQMEFHPDRLAVKKGDTVGVQLLFCPQGWEYSGNKAMAQEVKAIMLDDGRPKPLSISRMSNKVEFVYSGNPASATP